VVFVFSKRKCERYAYNMSNVHFTTALERREIRSFCKQSLSRLSEKDRQLPQVLRMQELLAHGVGVHHGGLLPIMKEIVEILFSRGFVRVLFATETFAMGVNMPARTVVFDSLSKPDGRESRRDLLPGEYTQMSGRAGRRGLDKVGTVITVCWREIPDIVTLKTILTGKPTRLESQFRLTYNMILNLLRVEDLKVEDMMKRSFAEAHSQRDVKARKLELASVTRALEDLEDIVCIRGAPSIEEYQLVVREAAELEQAMQQYLSHHPKVSQALGPGRVVRVVFQEYMREVGLIIDQLRDPPPHAGPERSSGRWFHVLFPLNPRTNFYDHIRAKHGPSDILEEDFCVLQIPQTYIVDFGKIRMKLPEMEDAPKGRPPPVDLRSCLRALRKGMKSFQFLDPVSDLRITDIDFVEMANHKRALLSTLTSNKCDDCPKLAEHYAEMSLRSRYQRQIEQLRFGFSEQSLQFMPDFETRVSVLQHLHYINESRTVLLKGRVAREMNTVTCELLATETIFENALKGLAPEEILSLFSALVFEERGRQVTEPKLNPTLEKAHGEMMARAKSLGVLQIEAGVDIDIDEYVRNVNWGMMEVVYEWARGLPFSDICLLTDILEGSIVRCIVRLDETCREIRNAARLIGDSDLFVKMEEASQMIKRDIVFASSLYLG